MKCFVTLLACFLVAGCSSWLPDERVVGNFAAASGDTVTIGADGRIFHERGGRKEFVGMVTVTRDTPLTIFVVAPDSSPLVGTVITFSGDRKTVSVEWHDALHRPPRSRQFQKME